MKGNFTGRARSVDTDASSEPSTMPSSIYSGLSSAASPPPGDGPEQPPGLWRRVWRFAAGLRDDLIGLLPSFLQGPYFPEAKLKTRLIVSMVALVVVTASVVGVVAYRNLEDALLHSETGRLESDVQALAMGIDSRVRAVRDDVAAIRGATAVAGIVRGSEAGNGVDPKTGDLLAEWRTRLGTLMTAQLDAKPNYLQMRFIGAADGGREIVRVQRDKVGGPVHAVADAELQQKGGHDYFIQAMRMLAGGVYISPVNLNREHGEVQVSHTPVLRAATPVFDDHGKRFGVIVINVAMRPIFDSLRTATRQGGKIYVVNDRGDFLVHPGHVHEFGFDLGQRYRIQDEFPPVAPLVHSDGGQSRIIRDSKIGDFGIAAATTRLAGGPKVTVMETLPLSVLSAPLDTLRMSTLSTGIAGVLFATLLAIVIARSLSNPLEKMTDGIVALKQQKPFDLPTTAGGEIGMLARAFEDFAEQERLYRSTLQSSYDAIFTNSLDGIITSWNPAAQRLYGYTPEEAIGQHVRMLVPDHMRDQQRQYMVDLRRGGSVSNLETVRRRKDGGLVEVSLAPSLVRAPSGEPLGVSVIARDITDRRQAEKRFRLAVESSPTGMVMVKADGTIVLINAEVERMFGYRKDELLGASIDLLVPERFRTDHMEYRSGFTGDPESRAMGAGRDLYARRKDASEFPIEIGLNPIPQPNELLILASVVDISERKEAQLALERQKTELERSNADLEQFAYVASHDLQEPLRMVASYTTLLAERYQDQLDERAGKYINYAVEGAKRMQQLITDLLDFSRVGTRAKPLGPVDTNEVVEKIVRALHTRIKENGADVTFGTLPTVLADETQLGMIFQNLIGNAVKFRADERPKVRIEAKRDDREWLFSVSDNGIGIDTKYSSRIFQMFQRLHERGRYDGSGIGLAIVKKIIDRHGGRIWFESELGRGTTFFFTLHAGQNETGGTNQ